MREILRVSVPLSLWLASFSAVYGLQGLVCSDRWTAAGLGLEAGRVALVLAALLAVTLQAGLLWALRAPSLASGSPALRKASVTLAIAALVAAAWTLLPVATTSICS